MTAVGSVMRAQLRRPLLVSVSYQAAAHRCPSCSPPLADRGARRLLIWCQYNPALADMAITVIICLIAVTVEALLSLLAETVPAAAVEKIANLGSTAICMSRRFRCCRGYGAILNCRAVVDDFPRDHGVTKQIAILMGRREEKRI